MAGTSADGSIEDAVARLEFCRDFIRDRLETQEEMRKLVKEARPDLRSLANSHLASIFCKMLFLILAHHYSIRWTINRDKEDRLDRSISRMCHVPPCLSVQEMEPRIKYEAITVLLKELRNDGFPPAEIDRMKDAFRRLGSRPGR
jgi:hypothetical protein